MPKIELRENKVLKLINVLSREVPDKEIFSHNKQITMLQSWLQTKGYQTQGPIIMYSSGIKGINSDGTPIIDSSLLIQLTTDKVCLELPYKFEKLMRIENCIMARFEDKADFLHYATNKLTLHAYESDIELSGETYMILIKQNEEKLLADIFMPVKTKGKDHKSDDEDSKDS